MTTGTDRVGQTVGNHRVLSLIGQGGMGAVYLAEHTVLGRRVTLFPWEATNRVRALLSAARL